MAAASASLFAASPQISQASKRRVVEDKDQPKPAQLFHKEKEEQAEGGDEPEVATSKLLTGKI